MALGVCRDQGIAHPWVPVRQSPSCCFSSCPLSSEETTSCSNAGLMIFQGQLSLHQKALVISLQQVPLSRACVFSYSVHAESVPKSCMELFSSSGHNKIFYTLC